MKFQYSVNWFDPNKQRAYRWRCDGSQSVALLVAKKKVADGMLQVAITVEGNADEDDPEDTSWPPVEAEIGDM